MTTGAGFFIGLGIVTSTVIAVLCLESIVGQIMNTFIKAFNEIMREIRKHRKEE
jgi:hypothetical protein